MNALIETSSLTKQYGEQTALGDATLSIGAGECVGLLGPNGAGKTTLLSLVEGLRVPTSGTVKLFGGDPRDAHNRIRLGSTPQATALPEGLRVGEVLELVAAHYPQPTPRAQIIDEFGLSELVRKQCGSLSGGQQRRVAVALAFVGNPELVLLDEPTTGLDVDGRRTLWQAVKARHAAGCTIVVTSHHLEEIEQLAQRVIVIDSGVVRADDTLAAIVSGVSRRRVSMTGVDAALVQALAPDAVLTQEDDVLTAVVPNSDDFVRALVASGVAFSDLAVRGATLEEAFLSLTAVSEGSR